MAQSSEFRKNEVHVVKKQHRLKQSSTPHYQLRYQKTVIEFKVNKYKASDEFAVSDSATKQ